MATYVDDVTFGNRLNAHPVLPADYLHRLRRRVAACARYGGVAHPQITDRYPYPALIQGSTEPDPSCVGGR